MEFRWIAAIALWTMLSGPVFVRLAAITPPPPQPGTLSVPVGQIPPSHPTAFQR